MLSLNFDCQRIKIKKDGVASLGNGSGGLEEWANY
jgi:hypothetical protein